MAGGRRARSPAAIRACGSSTCTSTRARWPSRSTRAASTSCSPRTSSATSCRTRRAPCVGSLGLLPSRQPGPGRRPLRARPRLGARRWPGKDVANPIGAILSAAMMLRHSFGLMSEANDNRGRGRPGARGRRPDARPRGRRRPSPHSDVFGHGQADRRASMRRGTGPENPRSSRRRPVSANDLIESVRSRNPS
ncbi:MAG: isocitrate/isopropylmalate family dehydrogenase [Ignavibacteriales bacterium]|nr:isocitrate/isopropylmalate family dehydrogenase [Ignavibacteriales bacterium]